MMHKSFGTPNEHIFKKILHLLLPQREDYTQIKDIESLPSSVQQMYCENTLIFYLCDFKNAIIRAAIHEAKFHDTTHAHKLLAATITNYLATTSHPYELIIPVPLSKQRQRERGYNQVVHILKKTTLHFDATVLEKENRPAQTTLSRDERLKNMHDAFSVPPHKADYIMGKHILLVDDVVTTGATLGAAKAALLPHQPASVTCLALAH